MTFEEMRIRLANRDQIREKQEAEERAEEEHELALAAQHRREVLYNKSSFSNSNNSGVKQKLFEIFYIITYLTGKFFSKATFSKS